MKDYYLGRSERIKCIWPGDNYIDFSVDSVWVSFSFALWKHSLMCSFSVSKSCGGDTCGFLAVIAYTPESIQS